MNHSISLVINLNKLSESTTVIVMRGLGISKGFEDRPRAEYCLFDATAMASLLTKCREVVQKKVGRLGLAGAALAADDDALVLLFLKHALVGRVRYRKDVRRLVRHQPDVLIKLYVLWIVNRIKLKRIQSYEDAADVGVDVARREPRPKIVQQGLFVQVRQLTEIGVLLVPRLTKEPVEVIF